MGSLITVNMNNGVVKEIVNENLNYVNSLIYKN